MVTITGFKQRESADGKKLNALRFWNEKAKNSSRYPNIFKLKFFLVFLKKLYILINRLF